MKWTQKELAQLRAEVEENQRRAGTVVWERLATERSYEVQFQGPDGVWTALKTGLVNPQHRTRTRDAAISVAEFKADRHPNISYRVVEVEL